MKSAPHAKRSAAPGQRGAERGGASGLALLAARGVLGGYLAAHGAQKLFGAFGGHGMGPTVAAFDQLGLRPAAVTARVAAVSELGGGVLTAAGAAHPLGRSPSPRRWPWPVRHTGPTAPSPPTAASSCPSPTWRPPWRWP